MRLSARLILGLCGLALAIPAVALADDQAASVPAGTAAQPKPHHHKGLFGRRHCVECQRAYVKAHDGVDIPAPPDLGPMAGTPGHIHTGRAGECLTCQGGGVVVSGPVVMSGDPHAPGYAVTNGPMNVAGAEAPGYAVVGEGPSGPDPSPIGVASARRQSWADPRMSAAGSRAGAGAVDPAVVPTGLPPAQVALTNPGHDRPRIIGHLLGIPKFGQMRRDLQDQERQKHAAISYDQPTRPITELPASVVYGKGDH